MNPTEVQINALEVLNNLGMRVSEGSTVGKHQHVRFAHVAETGGNYRWEKHGEKPQVWVSGGKWLGKIWKYIFTGSECVEWGLEKDLKGT